MLVVDVGRQQMVAHALTYAVAVAQDGLLRPGEYIVSATEAGYH